MQAKKIQLRSRTSRLGSSATIGRQWPRLKKKCRRWNLWLSLEHKVVQQPRDPILHNHNSKNKAHLRSWGNKGRVPYNHSAWREIRLTNWSKLSIKFSTFLLPNLSLGWTRRSKLSTKKTNRYLSYPSELMDNNSSSSNSTLTTLPYQEINIKRRREMEIAIMRSFQGPRLPHHLRMPKIQSFIEDCTQSRLMRSRN